MLAWGGGIFLLLLVCGVSCAIYSRLQRNKTAKVIASLNQAEIGTSGEALITIIKNAGGSLSKGCLSGKSLSLQTKEPCEQSEMEYAIYLGLPYWLNHILFEHTSFQHVLRNFGVHPWFVEAFLSTINGKISRISYSTVVVRTDRANVLSRVDIAPKLFSEPEGNARYTVHYVQERNLIPELHAWISPTLSVQDRVQLTEFRLDCLSTIRGCLEPAEISPGLWHEYMRQPH